jgi:hypothetical protein
MQAFRFWARPLLILTLWLVATAYVVSEVGRSADLAARTGAQRVTGQTVWTAAPVRHASARR